MKSKILIKNLTALDCLLEKEYFSLEKEFKSIPKFASSDTESEGYLKSNEIQGDIDFLLEKINKELENIFDAKKDKDLDFRKEKNFNGTLNYNFNVVVKNNLPDLCLLFKNIEKNYFRLVKIAELALQSQNYYDSNGNHRICFNMFNPSTRKVFY